MAKQVLTPQGLQELAADPATPGSGFLLLYAKTDHKTYIKDSTGAVVDLTATGTGGGTTVYYQATAPASPTTGTLWIDTSAASGTYDDLAVFGQDGTLATKVGTSRWVFPFACSILGVSASVGTAPTGASIILDVDKNGTTIFTTQANRPTIAAAANATASSPTPDVTAFAAGDYLTIDIDQVGSTVAGADLTVLVQYRRS